MSRSRPSGKAGVGVQGRKALPGDDVTPVMGRPPEPPAPSTLVIHVRGSPRLSRYGAAGDPVLDDRHERGQLGDEAIDFPWPSRIRLKISRLPEFIADERRSGELGFDSGGTVGAVAACRAVTPGSSVPGWLLLPRGRLDSGPRVRGWRGRG